MTSVERWMEILNWPTLPTFARIHHLPGETFAANYYLCGTIKETLDHITFSLEMGTGSDKLVIGDPGSGKTTFFYYLAKIASLDGLADEYHFSILHFNRLIGPTMEESREAAADCCLEIYREYFQACDRTAEFTSIYEDKSLSRTDKLNRVLNLIVRYKQNFTKKLLILIDDIDEVERAAVEPLLRFLYSFMEPISIQKWLSVRGTTLDHYKKSLLSFIRTKFPERVPFPRVDLGGIIRKRLGAVGPECKCPFSDKLCSALLWAYNYDLREAMGVFHRFLEVNKPGEIQDHTSEEYIQQFFEKALTKTLTQQRQYPNIHLDTRSANYPFERDVFCLLCAKATVDGAFVRIIQRYYSDTVNSLREGGGSYVEAEVPDLSGKELEGILRFLGNNQLIVDQGGDCYGVTPKGNMFYRLISEKYYLEFCRKEAEADNKVRSNLYWALASLPPKFVTDHM